LLQYFLANFFYNEPIKPDEIKGLLKKKCPQTAAHVFALKSRMKGSGAKRTAEDTLTTLVRQAICRLR
jgi:hypothetical protein